MRLRARISAVIVAISAALLPGTTTAQAAEENIEFKVWHWNIAGHVLHGGSTTSPIIEHAVTSIMNRDADFVSLNEVCRGQYNAILNRFAEEGWPGTNTDFARFAATSPASAGYCRGAGEEFGHALFSRYDIGVSKQYTLEPDGRKLLCAPLQNLPKMKFCNVHITTGPRTPGAPDNRFGQLNTVLDILNGFHAAGETYIVAGDFNVQPHYEHLDSYYAPSLNTAANDNNRGAHRELDDTDPRCPGYGEFTSTVTPEEAPPCTEKRWTKLDLIFARESRIVGTYTGDSLIYPSDCGASEDKPCTDHRVTTGTVTLRVSTS
jgi:endonuclease/exonuclease/phosphatase family metal-dependent hydrolase